MNSKEYVHFFGVQGLGRGRGCGIGPHLWPGAVWEALARISSAHWTLHLCANGEHTQRVRVRGNEKIDGLPNAQPTFLVLEIHAQGNAQSTLIGHAGSALTTSWIFSPAKTGLCRTWSLSGNPSDVNFVKTSFDFLSSSLAGSRSFFGLSTATSLDCLPQFQTQLQSKSLALFESLAQFQFHSPWIGCHVVAIWKAAGSEL